MQGVLELPKELESLGLLLTERLDEVTRRFDAQLVSDLDPVNRLVKHVERYRGKMLRPTLVLLCGMAAGEKPGKSVKPAALTAGHITAAAVCEMVHMATLVHDDVLDEADVRRRGATINNLYGNEPAVILGDLLISGAYHLCSQLEPPDVAKRAALAVGRASMVMCAGELLQLHHRQDYALTEATYYDIVSRKTGELISTSCELGAILSGAPEAVVAALGMFGRTLGIAFQIQDDLLDLTGSEASVGKSVHKDLEKGKLTLPVIHHLANASAARQESSLTLLAEAGAGRGDFGAPEALERALHETDSIVAASREAKRRVDEASRALDVLTDTPAKRMLGLMARAVAERSR